MWTMCKFRTCRTTRSSQFQIRFGLLDELSPCECKYVTKELCHSRLNSDKSWGSPKSDNKLVVKWRFVQRFDKDRRAFGASDTRVNGLVRIWCQPPLFSKCLSEIRMFFLKYPKLFEGRKGRIPLCTYYLFSPLSPHKYNFPRQLEEGCEGNA